MREAIERLEDKSSARRRGAAKKLRKIADPTVGPQIFRALEREIKDVRTWETQYQMVMAIGECRYAPARDLLRDMAKRPIVATTLYLALGDSIVRIGEVEGEVGESIAWCFARVGLGKTSVLRHHGHMFSWIRNRRYERRLAREASWVEERTVLAVESDCLTVVFEPMGALYEIEPGETLTIVFKGPPTHPGEIRHRPDYTSVSPGLVGYMMAFDSKGNEIDIYTGAPY
ncbi:hypothetical protein [Kitasatospora sp. NPDC059327]|uniref:hypothetical protein n=1 Tax=Kitasatospora sp. NPDC059327 TaxID=3346803 RepID=UPI0036984F49